MVKHKTLMITGLVVIVGIVGAFAGHKIYKEYKYNKALDFYRSSAESQKSLDNNQINDLMKGVTQLTSFTEESLDCMLDPDDCKDSLLIDFDDDNLAVKKNWTNLLNSKNVEVYREYFKYVTFTELSDTRELHTYSDDYSRGCSIQVRFSYPNLNKLLNYDLPVYCAENNLGDVDLSLTSELVLDYVEDNYKSNLIEQCLQIPIAVLDDNVVFTSLWLEDLEYFSWLDSYNVINGKFEKADLPEEFTNTEKVTELFKKGDIESILKLLSSDDDFYDEYKKNFTEMSNNAKACKEIGEQLLEINKAEYYPMRVSLTVKDELDDKEYAQFKDTVVVATCVPYVDFENSFYQNFNLTYINYADTDGSSVYGLLANSLLECYENYEVPYEE